MKSFLRLAVSLGLMAGFLYWAFADLAAGDLWHEMAAVQPYWLVAIVAMILVTAVLRAWRWVVLLRPVSEETTVLDATLALTICYAVNLVSPIPRAGEAARALSLRWRHGASISAVVGTIVVERVIDLLFLILFIATSAALLPGQIEEAFPGMQTAATVTLVLAIAALVGMVIVSAYQDRGVAFVERLLSRVSPRLAHTVADLLSHFIHGLAALRTPSAYLEILVSSCLLNLGYIFITWFSFAAFGFHRAPWHLGGEAALVVMAISSIGVVLPAQGGIGPYHFFYGNALGKLFAIPMLPAMACATLIHAISNLAYFVIGAPALYLQRRRHGSRGTLTQEFEQAT
jgi:glycosyltransferase 2 family protein